MARGALKGLKRNRPSSGEKVVVKGQLPQGAGGRSTGSNIAGASSHGGTSNPHGSPDLDGGDVVSWVNCECFFSLVLVGLLAALPFNLHTQELMQTPETYVARAMELSGEGAFDKAALLYERAVKTEETPERHVLLAEALVLGERKDEALWHYERAAALYDDKQNKVSTLLSLGQLQTDEGLSNEAVETYIRVLDLQDEDQPDELAEAHYQVAVSLLDSRRHPEALEQLEVASAMAPDFTKAQELLAHTLRDVGLVEEAVRRYKNITSQRSTDAGIVVQLGLAYHELCDFSQALTFYKKARSWPTKAAEVDYLTAALHSKSFRPPRAPWAYVSDVFDLEARKSAYLDSDAGATVLSDGACSNESFCTKLGTDRGMFYDVHGLIFDLVGPNMRLMVEAALGVAHAPPDGSSDFSSHGTERRQWLDILDLGCGRGRMGIELRSLANYITGVDLSKEALKHASRTKTYDSVKHGDALAVTKSMPQHSVDLVVAADLMPYFGDVTELMRAIADVVRPGGLVAFNADMLDEDDGTSGAGAGGNGSGRAYELRFTGRWSHRRKYVTQSVSAAGLSLVGVRVVSGRTRLISSAPGKIVLEALPKERQSTIFLCGKGSVSSRL